MFEEGKVREETGEPLFVDRYEIVLIPEHLLVNMPSSVQQFTADTAQGMMDHRRGRNRPYCAAPVLLLHVLWIRSRRPNNRSKCSSGPDSQPTCI